MVITRTPYRISFFGGGTDYPAWFREHGGEVVGTSIDKYCYISIRELPPFFEHYHRLVYSKIENVSSIDAIEHPAVREAFRYMDVKVGMELHHDGDLPARSGMGSSSSFAVGLLNAIYVLKGQYVSPRSLAKQAIHLEQELIKECVGSQDQILTAIGGLNRVIFRKDGEFSVEPIIMSLGRKMALQSRLLLFYTRVSRFASKVAQTQVENFKNQEKQLHKMKSMVRQAIEILGDDSVPLSQFGELLHESWLLKRGLSESVSNEKINQYIHIARQNGAVGGKILGAGGGGFLLFFAEPEHHHHIIGALSELVHVPFKFDSLGTKVSLYDPVQGGD